MPRFRFQTPATILFDVYAQTPEEAAVFANQVRAENLDDGWDVDLLDPDEDDAILSGRAYFCDAPRCAPLLTADDIVNTDEDHPQRPTSSTGWGEFSDGMTRLQKDYRAWVLDAVAHAQDVLPRAQERAFSHRIIRLLQGKPTEPSVGDEIVTLLGDNDCDENDQPRQAPPGMRGRVVDVAEGSVLGPLFHVVFESGTWVVLELYEICDPNQYTWPAEGKT